jgi:hypothetical protein
MTYVFLKKSQELKIFFDFSMLLIVNVFFCGLSGGGRCAVFSVSVYADGLLDV